MIYVDADACPVKDEVYRVARRYGLRVTVVANAPLRVPANSLVELVVRPGFGAADDWIAEQAGRATWWSRLTSRWPPDAWRRTHVFWTRRGGRLLTPTLVRRWRCAT
jgi:hypothetical protein